MVTSPAVDAHIASWPEAEQHDAELLRGIILDASPAISESIKFGIPFYDMNGLLMYFSRIRRGGGIRLAFCQGAVMGDPYGILHGTDRKHVRLLDIIRPAAEDWERIASYVLEAVGINRRERSFKQKKQERPLSPASANFRPLAWALLAEKSGTLP